ncbi:FKBP-type peptidyl-prolyl cis-trans isomerase [Pedobacter sp. L105]|uniref:FKBP-type peptidyl-prolyl cis-trans isomerase n=1 Tax=Pedobacter sp. L105 TaxID=1641871 RepID=UPI00131AAEA8|nr:FKBP-type peptidyl-prolyl cis-trans isomerase [Pedobacter sp. L105]
MLKKLSGFALALIGITAFFTSSCTKSYEGINSVDSTKISTYIKQNNLTSMVEDSAKTGYYYQIVSPGTGKTFVNSDSVLYNYSIKGLDNGTLYLDNRPNGNYNSFVGYTYNIAYQSVSYPILAVRDVMNKLKPGGVARILVPSYQAFGKNGVGSIPGNENIDLTITVYPETNQALLDDRLIREYVAAKGLTMTKDPSGVYYNVAKPGSGTYPITDNSTIYVKYTGMTRDGLVVDSDTTGNTSFTLGSGGLKGWTDVLPGKVQRDGVIRMILPSGLGYGTTTSGLINPNEIIDYNFTIVSVLQ